LSITSPMLLRLPQRKGWYEGECMRINLIQEKLMATIEIDGVKNVGANSFAQGDLSRPHRRV
jgi:hypothetical protein